MKTRTKKQTNGEFSSERMSQRDDPGHGKTSDKLPGKKDIQELATPCP